MTNRIANVRIAMKAGWVVLVLCVLMLGVGLAPTQAALFDGLFSGFEETLAEGLKAKGETLTLGDFYSPERPDGHGPIGTMGNHTHNFGEFMFSYRYMNMFMEGARVGSSGVSNATVLSPTGFNFLVTPTEMTMQMHMMSGMYGVNDTLTLMLMVPYLYNSMDHITRMGGAFTTRSEGLGDIRLQTLTRLYAVSAPSIGAHRAHLLLGMNFPSGSIDKRDRTPLGANSLLPYPMQTGTGTFAFVPGLAYAGEKNDVSWGLMSKGFIQIARNNQSYSVGDRYLINAWSAYRLLDWISASFRLNWEQWYNYDGADPRLAAQVANNLVFTALPNLRGGQRLDILGGANVLFPEFMGYENRLAVEYGAPVYQYLNGPQLETDHVLWLGWQLVH